jgi:hypothetical protein
MLWKTCHSISCKEIFILIKNKIFYLKEEGSQRTSIILGTWNHQKHVEWINPNPKKRSAGNTKDRQYEFVF